MINWIRRQVLCRVGLHAWYYTFDVLTRTTSRVCVRCDKGQTKEVYGEWVNC